MLKQTTENISLPLGFTGGDNCPVLNSFISVVARSSYSGPVEWLFSSAIFYNAAFELIKRQVGKQVVLDIGCSYGYGTYMMAERLSECRFIGVDLNEDVIAAARTSYRRNNLRYECSDISKQSAVDRLRETYNSFDAVTCFEVFEHVSRRYSGQILNNIYRLLKPGGILYISTPNKPIYDLRADTADHINEVTLDEFEKWIKAHNFSIDSVFGSNYVRPIIQKIITGTKSAARTGNLRNGSKLKSIIRRAVLTICQPKIVLIELLKKLSHSRGIEWEIRSSRFSLNNSPKNSSHIFVVASKPFRSTA